MTKHEQTMLDMGCPICEGNIELYDTLPTGDGGRYRCPDCGRDTVWKVGKAMSFTEVVQSMKAKMAEKENQKATGLRRRA